MSNKEEGIPRYELEVRYVGKTSKPLFLFHQKRTFGEERELLINTHLIPRRVQDVIASSADITVVGSIVAMSAIVDWNVRSRAKIATQELKGLEDCLDELSRGENTYKETLGNARDRIRSLFAARTRVEGKKINIRTKTIASRAYSLGHETAVKALKGNNFPSNPLDRENIKLLTRDEIYIALYSGLYCAWEGLRAADVEGFNHNNPFEPIMNLISLGFVGLSFHKRSGREMLQVYEYRISGEERQVIQKSV